LGTVATVCRRYPEGRRRHEEALAIYSDLRNTPGIAHALFSLGAGAWYERDYRSARTLLTDALGAIRTLGDQVQEEGVLSFLGMTAFDEDDLEAARSYFKEGLAIARAFGGKGAVAVSLY